MHSGCENDPIDLEGLHESVVDSDEDLADSMDVSWFDEKNNYLSTMWKFKDFSVPLILREIDFSKCSPANHVSLADLEASSFDQIDFT